MSEIYREEHFYQATPEAALAKLNSSASGLSAAEAADRLKKNGLNQLREKGGVDAGRLLLEQFQGFIVWVLIAAALVAGLLGEWLDSGAIVAIVILNACLGFVQSFRAEKSLAALKKLAAPNCKVIRGGERRQIPAVQLVPGDVVELEAGDNVPADARLLQLTANFTVQEASLTGESSPVNKTTVALAEKEVPLADRANMLYLGTTVTSGKAKALVVATGMKTELGRIAGLIQGIEQETTPLQKKLDEFSKWLVYLCFFLVGLVFLLGWLRGGELLEVFLTAVSLAVAAIPEGLPAVVTIALAIGVQRMVKRSALIRKLPSVETLGCATVICTDKTGTLTKNEMTVQAVYADGRSYTVNGIGYAPQGEYLLNGLKIEAGEQPGLIKTLISGVLCNSAELTPTGIVGDPTEAALLTAAAKAGLTRENTGRELHFVEEIPFDSERKQMTMIFARGAELIAYSKGAPDSLLRKCRFIEEHGQVRELTADDQNRFAAVNDGLAGQALRVLAFAYRPITDRPEKLDDKTVERDLILVGLMAMIDPPRDEARQAIADCRRAGIRTVMITGDHKNTAVAIARSLGFFPTDAIALTGEELDRLDDQELTFKVDRVPVYARVSPEHKLRIVKAWRRRGEIVAMTGDGVNDAPAVKEADIGVAMGITGTDVTKEVSDMVVTDDNFASIVAAIEEGRGIYDNIKKFVHYLLSCNAGEILVMFLATLIGWPLPLLPIHILWVNLVTDGLPALALGMDPIEPGIMSRPPRKKDEPVVPVGRAGLILLQGLFIALCVLAAFSFVLFIEGEGIIRARTAAFIVLCCAQLFHALNCRSQTSSFFPGMLTNPWLILAVLFSFILQMVVVYYPPVQLVFKTEALGLADWLMVLVLSSLPLWGMEIVKLVNIRKRFIK